jgi:beta-galactosidase
MKRITDEETDGDLWMAVSVPSNWTLHPDVDDSPIYTNIKYPFSKCEPPLVPQKNPTAIYHVTFSFPQIWLDRSQDNDEFYLLCHGIESAYYVYFDSAFVGFAKDSRLLSEFNITAQLLQNQSSSKVQQRHSLQVVVAKWCDGIYVEDQDQWYLSGK